MMNAVEVLEWLNTADEETLVKVFDCTDFDIVFDMYTSQKIVDRIEKYEAEKKCKCNSCNQKHCEEDTGNGMCYKGLVSWNIF